MPLLAKARGRARHRRLITLANELIRDDLSTVNGTTRVTPADYTAYVFGCSQIRLDEAEAADYLNAVLVARGLPRLNTETTN
ncbi:hypothetical protein ABZ547_34230 [Streptomyces sparsogenes]|uniref:hypothetical protein n=1 Tax=Streptomyces sparsogenes TaxID=67365 RepID=UPI0033FE03B0